MAEFIDRQKAIEQIKAEWAKLPLTETTGFGILMRVLKSIPAADVRPVVLCKDCEYYFKDEDGYEMCENSEGYDHVTENGFCAWGRKEGGKLMDDLIKRLRKCATEAGACKTCELYSNPSCTDVLMEQAADAIEELSKRLNSVTAERDAAMKRLCEWCGVGCSMENRRAELCEIASVGLEFLAEEGA